MHPPLETIDNMYCKKSLICFYVSFKDDGNILFPSMTVCKKRMYTKYPQILIDYFQPQHMDTMVNYDTVKSWVKEHTHNRSTLFKRLSHKTQGASNQYPCNTVSGDDIGKPCSSEHQA